MVGPLSNLVQKQDHKYNFRYTNLLQIPQVKSSRYSKSSFTCRYAAPVLWNSLPDNNRNCSNFNEFKNLISFWNGKSCMSAYHCSDSPLFRRPIFRTTHYSDNPLFRQHITPTAHFSRQCKMELNPQIHGLTRCIQQDGPSVRLILTDHGLDRMFWKGKGVLS
jgi:hypothetical protein